MASDPTALTKTPVIGIIGGSGLYDIDGLEDKVWRQVATPWGMPSDALLFGRLGDVRCVFLPRHGRGHPTVAHAPELPRQYRRAEALGRDRRDLACPPSAA